MLLEKVVEGILFVGVFVNSCFYTLFWGLPEGPGEISLMLVKENFPSFEDISSREIIYANNHSVIA